MPALIELKNISFTYADGRQALSNISFVAVEHERVALIGPNGAGKSTLLLTLNGILRGEGKIFIDGMEMSDQTLPKIRRAVGLVFQDPNDQLFCPTVGDDVAFGPLHFEFEKNKINNIVQSELKKVDMEDKSSLPAHHLSIGERRRVTLATVLACNPKILALDEPAAMLDTKRRNWLIDFLNRCEKTVVLATHDLDFALKTCNRAIIMRHGRIIADDEIKTLLSNQDLLKENEL